MKLKKLITTFLFSVLLFSASDVLAQAKSLSLSRSDSAEILKCQDRILKHRASGSTKEEARNYNQIAHIYWNHNQHQLAVDSYEKSIVLNKQIGNENGVSTINNHLGLIYSDLGQYTKSLNCFEEALKYRRTEKNKQSDLTSTLISVSVVYKKLKQYDKGIKVLEEALKAAKEESSPQRLQTCYGSLSEIYELAGDSKKSVYYFEHYRAMNELLHNKTKDKMDAATARAALAEAEKIKKQYELLKKQSELDVSAAENLTLNSNLTKAELEVELTQKEADNNKLQVKIQNERRVRAIWIFSGGLLFLGIIAFILLRSNKHKREANKQLSLQNNQITEQSSKITKQRDDITLAKNEIEKQNISITKSITYANMIQTAMLNKTRRLSDYFAESFILFKPRDIVSGDFYWYGKVGEKIITVAADCTGHGVPGAFLSMIGNQLFNIIVIAEKETNPAKILYKVEDGIREALNQNHTHNSDGMDVAICVFDYNTMKMQFAGAKNPVVIVTEGKAEIIKGDKFSLGGIFSNKTEKVFTVKEADIKKGAMIYTFSDGLADQLGGEKGRLKYSRRRLIQDLEQMSTEPMEQQKEKLYNNYTNWRTTRKRIDDVLLIGIKV